MINPVYQLYDELLNPEGRPIVSGILNITEDSFFDGGRYLSADTIEDQVNKMISQGARMIDLGACSTRPGAIPVSERQEIERLLFAMEILRTVDAQVPVSIDTFRGKVVEAVVEKYGPVWVNDISGGDFDEDLLPVVAHLQLPYILMHIQGTPQTMQVSPQYVDILEDMYEYFSLRLMKLKDMSIQRILIDPGFGFGKTVQHNYLILQSLERFSSFELPLYIGLSRKSMIYKLLQITPEDSLNASTALHMLALRNGATVLRVHDVAEAVQCVQLNAFLNACSK